MTYGKEIFINADDFAEKFRNQSKEIFIFGTSSFAERTTAMLDYFNIEVYAFVDNNPGKWGSTFHNKKIVSPDDILKANNPVVVIGNSFLRDMCEQFSKMNLKEIYVFQDQMAMPFDDVMADRAYFFKYFENPEEYRTNKVLIKDWDGLGDAIIKLGIFKYLSELPDGAERIHIITKNKSNYELLKTMFHHVTLINRDKFIEDVIYRREILEAVNKEYYSCALNFYTLFCSSKELMNKYNTNIDMNYNKWNYLEWSNGVCNSEQHLMSETRFVRKVFGISEEVDLKPDGLLAPILSDIGIPNELNGRYVSVNLIGESNASAFPAEKAAKVLEFLIEEGYQVALLGYGKKDEAYYEEVQNHISDSGIVNLCTKLNVFQSLKVIEKSQMFWGIDSGLAHGAYAMDKSGLVLMAPHSYSRYAHPESYLKYIVKEIECYPCYECIHKRTSTRFNECLSLLQPEEVITVLRGIIANGI